MSNAITIHNGGEAPPAAKSPVGTALVSGDQIDVMQQNGGQAPDAGAQYATTSSVQQANITGGEPPLGGVVHGS